MGRVTRAKLQSVVEEVIGTNLKAAGDFRSGREETLNFLAGEFLKAVRGWQIPEMWLRSPYKTFKVNGK